MPARAGVMAFAIKAEIHDPRAETFVFTAQKTMYGGKYIAEGDLVFLFASENEGGRGLVGWPRSLPTNRRQSNAGSRDKRLG